MVEGGAGGYDVVALVSDGSAVVSTITGPQSGTIARGDNVVTYAGMEPLAVSGTKRHDHREHGLADHQRHRRLHSCRRGVQRRPEPERRGDARHLGGRRSGRPHHQPPRRDEHDPRHGMNISLSGTIHLNGASGAERRPHARRLPGTITIAGNGGADTYQLHDDFGSATVATGGGRRHARPHRPDRDTHSTDTTFGDSQATGDHVRHGERSHRPHASSPATIVTKIDGTSSTSPVGRLGRGQRRATPSRAPAAPRSERRGHRRQDPQSRQLRPSPRRKTKVDNALGGFVLRRAPQRHRSPALNGALSDGVAVPAPRASTSTRRMRA